MRRARIKIVGDEAVYHLISRIVGGERLLGDREKERLRRMLWRQAEFCGIEIITYCLMSNHIHILARVHDQSDLPDEELVRRMIRFHGKKEEWVKNAISGFEQHGKLSSHFRTSLQARMGDVSVFMKELKQRFSLWYNAQNKRFGTLWAERFKSLLVQDSAEAVRTVAMYVDLNPVRAGLVEDPAHYRFCGYAEAMVGNAAIRRSICKLEGASWRQAARNYRIALTLQSSEANHPKKKVLDEATVKKRLREGGEVSLAELLRLRVRYFTDGLVLGSPEFIEEKFREFRDRFSERRTSGARRMNGAGTALSHLATARDLKVRPVG